MSHQAYEGIESVGMEMTQRLSCPIDTKKGPAFVTVVDNVVAIRYSILESTNRLPFAGRSTSQATHHIGALREYLSFHRLILFTVDCDSYYIQQQADKE